MTHRLAPSTPFIAQPAPAVWLRTLALLGGLGGLGLAALGSAVAADRAAPAPSVAGAALAAVTARPAGGLATSAYDGVIEAVRQTSVATQVPGAIVQLSVKAGDRVAAGQVLLRIDAQTAGQAAAASDAQVQALRAAHEVAAKDYARQQQLAGAQFISAAALERAEAVYKASQAQLDAQRAQAGAARTQIGLHTVRAPFAGVVAEVPVALGDMALPGRPLLTLYDPGALRVSVAVPQSLAAALAARLAAGERPRIELPGLAISAVQPVRARLLPMADAATHTVTLQADLPAGLKGLSPGQFARAWLPQDPAPGAPSDLSAGSVTGRAPAQTVPLSAIVRRAELTGLYVLDAQGRPLLRQVRLGTNDGTQVEVLAGLMAGERVATDPQAAALVR